MAFIWGLFLCLVIAGLRIYVHLSKLDSGLVIAGFIRTVCQSVYTGYEQSVIAGFICTVCP